MALYCSICESSKEVRPVEGTEYVLCTGCFRVPVLVRAFRDGLERKAANATASEPQVAS